MTNKNRNKITCIETIRNKFAKISGKVAKCREYTEITTNFLEDAYSLAKAIQEIYGYELRGEEDVEKALEELGVILDTEWRDIEVRPQTDSCIIALKENQFQISIICNIYSYIEHYLFCWRTYRKIGEVKVIDKNNRVFCYFYAVAIMVMFYEQVEEGEHIKFNYGESIQYSIDEQKAIKVALFLLYIKYDYDYRVKKHPFLATAGERELPDVHPCFCNPYFSGYIKGKLLGGLEETQEMYEQFEEYAGHRCDFLTSYTLDTMIKDIASIEKSLGEKYRELSKMFAPESLYLEYKNRDYTKFGAMRKLDF